RLARAAQAFKQSPFTLTERPTGLVILEAILTLRRLVLPVIATSAGKMIRREEAPMVNDARTPPYPNSQSPGLPPVAPPTGKFLIQLFLVPGVIVALVVGLLLICDWLINRPRSPESY